MKVKILVVFIREILDETYPECRSTDEFLDKLDHDIRETPELFACYAADGFDMEIKSRG